MKPYYENENGRLYHGDCLEIMPEIENIDLVLTDPPYLIHAGSGGGCFGKRDHLVNTGGFTDKGVSYDFLDSFDNWFVFCSLKQLHNLLIKPKNNKNLLTWCKSNPVPTCNNKYLPDVEYIVHSFSKGRLFGKYKDKSCFINVPCGNKKTEHPNEKPEGIINKLLILGSEQNDLILDPFLGSGTTAIACGEMNRKWIGIEKEEKYCEISAKRIEQETKQLKLF